MTSHIGYTQNFLVSRKLVEQMVALAKLPAGATVLEIGPGKGIITAEIARRIGRDGQLTGIELDPKLAHSLDERFSADSHINIVQGDILTFDLAALGRNYRIVSNIPFNITSPLLDRLFTQPGLSAAAESAVGPLAAHLILQRDAIIGRNRAGYTVETFKSLLVRPIYDITEVHQFSRHDFRPRPSVETSLFAFERRDKALVAAEHYPLYKNFLAFVTNDRVGEGAWLKLFSKKQLAKLAAQTNLVLNRGIKSQPIDAIVATFTFFQTRLPQKHALVANALQQLRQTQARTTRLNTKGNHHRTRARARTNKRPTRLDR